MEIWTSHLYRAHGAPFHEFQKRILKNCTRKSNGNLQFIENFHEFRENFLFKTLILIKILRKPDD